MAIERRKLLTALGAGLAAGPLALSSASARGSGDPGLYLSGSAGPDGRFRLSAFRADGTIGFELPLPGRGHAVALSPAARQAVIFARRPGRFAEVVDLTEGKVLRRLASPDGRHFYGHGVFAPDGSKLFTTENDYEAGRGAIGVWEAGGDYRRLGELSAHGIGPHDIRFLTDGRTLVVANGGIQTHPESGRHKLNLPTMAPSLVYLDAASGRRLGAYRLPPALHRLSIRHLAVGPGDAVVIAMQYEGPRSDRVPLVALHGGEERIALLRAPPEVERRMRQYCGSVCFDAGGGLFAVSSPRGGLTTFWSLASRGYLGAASLADGCGVSATGEPGSFLISSGRGGALIADLGTGREHHLDTPVLMARRWDNHLTRWPRG